MKKLLLSLTAATCLFADSDTLPTHKFSVWKNRSISDAGSDYVFAYHFGIYIGWINGTLNLIYTLEPKTMAKTSCLADISAEQALAMIDKYYDAHPEEWSAPLSVEIWKALTVKGSPCENH